MSANIEIPLSLPHPVWVRYRKGKAIPTSMQPLALHILSSNFLVYDNDMYNFMYLVSELRGSSAIIKCLGIVPSLHHRNICQWTALRFWYSFFHTILNNAKRTITMIIFIIHLNLFSAEIMATSGDQLSVLPVSSYIFILLSGSGTLIWQSSLLWKWNQI